MPRLWLTLILVILAAFAIPALLGAIESILPFVIIFVVLMAAGSLLYQRRRRW